MEQEIINLNYQTAVTRIILQTNSLFRKCHLLSILSTFDLIQFELTCRYWGAPIFVMSSIYIQGEILGVYFFAPSIADQLFYCTTRQRGGVFCNTFFCIKFCSSIDLFIFHRYFASSTRPSFFITWKSIISNWKIMYTHSKIGYWDSRWMIEDK